MSKKDKFFTKVKIGSEEQKLTAVNISGKYLVTGDSNGNLTSYEIGDKKLHQVEQISLKKNIDKILIPPNKKIVFVLCEGEIYFYNLPKLSFSQLLQKDKNNSDIFINIDDPKCDNMLLVLNKRKKIKLYDFEYDQGKVVLTERSKETYSIEETPSCAVWTTDNTFIYASGNKTYWVNLNSGGKTTAVDFDRTVQIINLDDKIAISNVDMTLFMKEGSAYQFNPITHMSQNGLDFKGYAIFKNHLIALYKNALHIYKKGEQQYDFVESLDFGQDGNGKYLVASDYKVIVVTESIGKFNILDFQERPYEEQIKVLIDQKLYNNGLEKLIQNVPEEDDTKAQKVEKFFLDCAWGCIEGNKKDFNNSIKYLSLTNFNPFEFIYMFFDSLSVDIIHSDKRQEILDHRKENQLLGIDPQEKDEKEAYKFLITILTMKRNFLLSPNKNESAEASKSKINFMSSSRGKINLSDSKTEINLQKTFDAINSALIKSMIKLKKDPKEIETNLDNESVNFAIFQEFENDQFFADEKNKNLDETKFTLAYINEKKGNFDIALQEWENFGNSKPKDDKFSIIARDRTKKIFYKFKENKDFRQDKKEKLIRQYIKWLLKKYPYEGFEVILKTELISNKVFMEEIIPEIEKEFGESSESVNLREKFLEYCNKNQQSEKYQTQLLQLYADKLFTLKPKDNNPGKLEGETKKYHDEFMKIIKDPKSCYNKRAILEYIEQSWLKEPRKYLYSQLKEHDKALNELFKDARTTLNFEELEKYCEENTESKPDIFQSFYQLLSEVVNVDCQKIIDNNLEKINQLTQQLDETRPDYTFKFSAQKGEIQNELKNLKEDVQKFESLKKPYEAEMLKILKKYGSLKKLDPIFALEYANEHWNICENNEFFNYLLNIVRDYTVEGNKYKIGKNLSEMGLVYKEKEAYEFKKKYVTIDSEKTCDFCKKKIGNTIFVVYPNLRVYHSKCATNHSIDPMTGVDFSKKKYVE